MKRYVWIVEGFYEGLYGDLYGARPSWKPTVGVALNRDDARQEARAWRKRNPSDKYRVRRYVPVSHLRKKP